MIENFLNKVWHGDARNLLRALPTASIDSVITDAMYGTKCEYEWGTLCDNLKKANPDADYLGALISFKKSSSTLLRNSEYSEFYSYFLGHAEKTMAGQHYAGLDPARFAEAQKWLGKQYGIK